MLIGHLCIFFGEMSLQILCLFLNQVLLLLSLRVLHIFWILFFYQIWFTNIFSDSVGCSFILLILSLNAQNFRIFMTFNLSIFSLLPLSLVSYPRNHCQIQRCDVFVLMLSSQSFIVVGLTLRSSIHFELTFVYSVS